MSDATTSSVNGDPYLSHIRDVLCKDLLERMPVSDEEACAWIHLRLSDLVPRDIVHCGGCDFQLKYKPGKLWKMIKHVALNHGIRVRVGG